MMPSIAGQSTPFGSWPCIWNTCSRRLICLGLARDGSAKPCLSCRRRCLLDHLRQGLHDLVLGVVDVLQRVDERSSSVLMSFEKRPMAHIPSIDVRNTSAQSAISDWGAWHNAGRTSRRLKPVPPIVPRSSRGDEKEAAASAEVSPRHEGLRPWETQQFRSRTRLSVSLDSSASIFWPRFVILSVDVLICATSSWAWRKCVSSFVTRSPRRTMSSRSFCTSTWITCASSRMRASRTSACITWMARDNSDGDTITMRARCASGPRRRNARQVGIERLGRHEHASRCPASRRG